MANVKILNGAGRVLAASVLLASLATVSNAQEADVIYFGGDILTMDDDRPTVEALAVGDGLILAIGNQATVEANHKGDDTRMVDLASRTLMPGFIDSHSHLFNTSLKQAMVNLDPPPAGGTDSIDKMVATLSERLRTRDVPADRWLLGWGYDHAQLAEGRHPTREDLDRVSTEVPVLIMHFSNHQVVANSKALELAGIDAESEPPQGGNIQRMPGSREPNGIVEETAMLPFMAALSKSFGVSPTDAHGHDDAPQGHFHPQPTVASGEDAVADLIEEALDVYMSEGFTTVTEFGGSPTNVALLRRMADEGRLPVDVMVALIYLSASAEEAAQQYSKEYKNRFRVGGGKINLDGGTPGRTAFLREPYHVQLPGEAGYRGYSSISDQGDIDALVASYYAADIPIHIHAIGDAALDQAIAAIESAEAAHGAEDRRTQIIHVQLADDAQLDALKALDTTLTFQVTHVFYFGDFHVEQILGPERAARLTPVRTALDKGFSPSIHHDSPVHPVDQITLIWIAVNRVTRSGEVLGPDERISVMDALKASTINAAYQFREEDRKGSLVPGKLADMIILDRNPLEVPPMELRDLEVLETIKEGETVFARR